MRDNSAGRGSRSCTDSRDSTSSSGDSHGACEGAYFVCVEITSSDRFEANASLTNAFSSGCGNCATISTPIPSRRSKSAIDSYSGSYMGPPTSATRTDDASERFMARILASLLSGAPAAVDHESRSCHERRFVAREVERGGGNLVGPAHAAHRLSCRHLLPRLLGVGIFLQTFGDPRCFNTPGTDAIDANAVQCVIEGHAAGQADDCKLAGAICKAIAN